MYIDIYTCEKQNERNNIHTQRMWLLYLECTENRGEPNRPIFMIDVLQYSYLHDIILVVYALIFSLSLSLLRPEAEMVMNQKIIFHAFYIYVQWWTAGNAWHTATETHRVDEIAIACDEIEMCSNDKYCTLNSIVHTCLVIVVVVVCVVVNLTM